MRPWSVQRFQAGARYKRIGWRQSELLLAPPGSTS